MVAEKQKTILIIDDDAVLAELYRVKFVRAGFTVLQAESGAKAMEILKSGVRPSVILLDLLMPNMDGFAFIQEAKHKGIPLPPLIVFTSQEDDIHKVKSFALGATQFVQKASATPGEIIEKIQLLLDEKKASGPLG